MAIWEIALIFAGLGRDEEWSMKKIVDYMSEVKPTISEKRFFSHKN